MEVAGRVRAEDAAVVLARAWCTPLPVVFPNALRLHFLQAGRADPEQKRERKACGNRAVLPQFWGLTLGLAAGWRQRLSDSRGVSHLGRVFVRGF